MRSSTQTKAIRFNAPRVSKLQNVMYLMSNPKHIPGPWAAKQVLDVEDIRLKKFLELKEKAKSIEKELEQLRAEIVHIGSHSTEHFAVIVESSKTVRAPSKEILLKEYGESIKRLFVEGTRIDIKVAKLKG